MRLTIIAGMILGASLAVQSMLGAHAAAKLARSANGVGVHVRVVAPWYIAANSRRCNGSIRSTRYPAAVTEES
jgi:hypothetical protein